MIVCHWWILLSYLTLLLEYECNFKDKAWSDIGLRLATPNTANTVTQLISSLWDGPSRDAWVFTNVRNPYLGFNFSRVNTSCSCPLFFLADKFSITISWSFCILCLNLLRVSDWLLTILSANLPKCQADVSECC